MRLFALVSTFCAVLAFAGCGGDSAPDLSTVKKAVAKPSKPPKIHIPSGPPPKHLIVRDLKKGYGAVAKWGQRLGVRYVAFDYKTRKRAEIFWKKGVSFSFSFGTGEVRKGWDIGLKGMRVGGRRELILPSRLAYGTGALAYVVELLEIS